MRLLAFWVVITLLAGCAAGPSGQRTKLYWPPPPDTARLVYEATLRDSNSVALPDTESRLQALATNAATITGNRTQWLVKPYDIAVSQGLVVVSDTLLSAVHVFDLPRKKLFAIGWRGQAILVKPLGVALDAGQNIYVADAGLKQIVKFDKQGHYLAIIGMPQDFSRLIDVAVSPLNKQIYALDRGGVDSASHRFQVYAADGKLLKTVGTRGMGNGEFNHPAQISVANDGRVFVLDSGNFRVQIFSPEGDYLDSWGKLGKGLGNFARPRGLAVSQQGYVFITDSAYQNYQIFDVTGQLLTYVGRGGGDDLPGQYMLPAGIAVDETNRIYVVDQIRQKIEVFRLLGDDEQ